MSKKKLFSGFSEEKQKQYERERYDPRYEPDKVKELRRLGQLQQGEETIRQEGKNLHRSGKGDEKGSPRARSAGYPGALAQHLRYFYEPTLEILRGLGRSTRDPDFIAIFRSCTLTYPITCKRRLRDVRGRSGNCRNRTNAG